MDKQAISSEIEKIINGGSSLYDPPQFINPNSQWASFIRSFVTRTGRISHDSLLQTLRQQPDLQLFDGGVLLVGRGGHGLDLTYLAEWLVARALLNSPDEAVERLDGFLRQDFPPSYEILALTGVSVGFAIELLEGIRLVPFGVVPRSLVTDTLTGIPTFIPGGSFSISVSSASTAALMGELRDTPRLAEGFPDESGWDAIKLHESLMLEIANLLTLFGPSPVAPIAHWIHVDESIPLGHLSHGWGSPSHEILPSKSVDISAQASNIEQLIRRYLPLSSEVKMYLEMPIKRLNLAARRSSVVDAAVELRIALESLLTSELDEKTEIAYKLRLRGALLGATELEDRKRLFDTLNDVYNICSKATHRGAFTGKIAATADQLIDEGMKICANLIIRVIERSSIPDWKEFALSGSNSGLSTPSTSSPT